MTNVTFFNGRRLAKWLGRIVAQGLFAAFALNASPLSLAAEPPVSFNRQIQPILSENCYHCHGPDSAARKPKKHPLRLDRSQFAFEARDDGKPVMVQGDPAGSPLLRRIKSADQDEVMPPPSEHKTLKPQEIALIEKWIAQGAKYEAHWAFIPPTRPKPPVVAGSRFKSPIDSFVASRLKEAGLQMNPEENRARLFRRLSFDLTGLPPEPRDLQAFLQNHSATAYEKAVDAMLSSDASAEHFARFWLDAVRYADTQGIHHDHMRNIWPYRDWVIGAYKANMSFDRFTVEQLAGDLLPGAGLDQKIASGYNRLLPTTGEGGSIEDEYRAIYAKDRVDTTSAVWLGLTTGCATCHDHKFDPITTKDFYSFTAFFRNNSIPALDNGENANTPPLAFVPRVEDRERWPVLESEIAKVEHAIPERKNQAKADFDQWLEAAKSKPGAPPSRDDTALYFALTEGKETHQGLWQNEPLEWAGGQETHSGPFGEAPLLATGDALKGAAPELSRTGAASFGAFLYVEDKPQGAVFSRMNKAEGYRGWDLLLSDGRPTVHIIDQFPDTALKITAKETLKPGRWHHVMAVFDGSKKGASALQLYIDGRAAPVEVNNNNLGPNITPKAPFRLGGRSDNEGIVDTPKNGKVFAQDLRFYGRALSADEIVSLAAFGLVKSFLAIAPEQRDSEAASAMMDVYLAGFDAPARKLYSQLGELKTEQARLRERGSTTLIMDEKKDTEPAAYVLVRGNYASKGAKVAAATPESLPPFKEGWPRNRLGLAQWMVSRDNPLTARVTVNRLWSELFGSGIVETTEDFGVMGARPTNQDLLDWLAVELMDSGWDFRHIVKTMVLSSAYRQSAAVTPAKLEKDPSNKLVSRGPHFRLDAEEIRDEALAASGLLMRRVGGPSTRPYQPEGVWEAVAMTVSNTRVYQQDHGDGLYRRSVYTFWKRIAPPPALEILNAPSREVFCTRRERSNTPLQAFVTMNDTQFVEAARALAAHAIESSTGFNGRLNAITEALIARRMDKLEQEVVHRMLDRSTKKFLGDPAAAKALITVGESKAPEKLPPAELAAWTLVASEVMNMDESLTK